LKAKYNWIYIGIFVEVDSLSTHDVVGEVYV